MRKLHTTLLLLALYFNSFGQNVNITIVNQAANSIYYEWQGKFDSVKTGQTFLIDQPVAADKIPAWFFLYVKDPEAGNGVTARTIRILSADIKGRQILIDPNNKIQFSSDSSELLADHFYRRIKRNNLWQLVDSMINARPDDVSSAEIIRNSICEPEFSIDTIQLYFDKLTARVKQSHIGQSVAGYITGRKALQVGKTVKTFTLTDTLEKAISLSDIKSDYVLLDFWFSRCGPCIASFPALAELYNKTDRSKLEIIGLSVDTKKETDLWKSTIRKYHLPWINLLDPDYDIAFKTFSITLYPTKVLLDKKRRIVKINPENAEIEELLK